MTDAIELCQSFAFEGEDTPLISPCLLFEAHLEFAEGPEVLDFYRRVREALGTQLTHYSTGSGHWTAINKRSETLMQTWCANPTPWPKKQYLLTMNGADSGDTSAAMRIDFLYRPWHAPDEALLKKWRNPPFSERRSIYPYSSLYCMLPLDHPLAQDDRFVEWIRQFMIFSEGRFISGSCGYGLNVPINLPSLALRIETNNRIASLLLRYPGLDLMDLMLGMGLALLQRDQVFMDKHRMAKGRPYLKRVNWLTFLSEDQVDWLGGKEALQGRFHDDKEIKLHWLAHGVCIQAGPQPQLGDANANDYIPAYQKVARVVRPVRIDSIRSPSITHDFDEHGVIEWLNAFDQDKAS